MELTVLVGLFGILEDGETFLNSVRLFRCGLWLAQGYRSIFYRGLQLDLFADCSGLARSYSATLVPP